MSELSSSAAKNKRLILQNPDGTYTHCKLKLLMLRL